VGDEAWAFGLNRKWRKVTVLRFDFEVVDVSSSLLFSASSSVLTAEFRVLFTEHTLPPGHRMTLPTEDGSLL